jgi:hypothetical protein
LKRRRANARDVGKPRLSETAGLKRLLPLVGTRGDAQHHA